MNLRHPIGPSRRAFAGRLVRGAAVIAMAIGWRGVAVSAALPYDEQADAPADLDRALATGRESKRPVLVVFGANWCEDCRALDAALKQPKNARRVAREFVLVKVDVGNFDRNLELNARYGRPIKGGIPAAVVIAPDGRVVYATRRGELADARRMSDADLVAFFRNAAGGAAQ